MTPKSQGADLQEICERALQRAIPSKTEERETLRFSKNLAETLENDLGKAGIEAQAQVEGSIAKDTWLAGEKDIDLFILLPRTYKKTDFNRVLDIAKNIAGQDYIEAYAEHPYVEAKIDSFTVDFVPCFKVERAEEAGSSVDRTPLHTLYVKTKIKPKVRNEVRLVKRFMRGINTYGAEIKVGGFSGYLCEILALNYGSFLEILKNASNWHQGELIDIERHYEGREEEARKIFQEPLVVVDPVDKDRNVASPVRIDRLNEFIAASREFLRHPNLEFFYPRTRKALPVEKLILTMNRRGSTAIFVKTGVEKTVPDILWGQLHKSQKTLRNLITQHGFTLIRDDVWSNEKTTSVFLLELQSRFLPTTERHIGPPIEGKEDCEKFLKTHSGANMPISGPRIEKNHWVVERKRKYTDAIVLLRTKLRTGGRNIGIATQISQAFLSQLEIWTGNEIKEYYSSNPEFAKFLTEYLKGRPEWFRWRRDREHSPTLQPKKENLLDE